MADYVAILHKDPGSDYGVSFPDFPGCVSAGATMAEAMVMAEEALAGHIETMAADGDPIPAPMSLDKAKEHEFAEDAVAFVLVNARSIGAARQRKRINITLPQEDLERIDDFAKRSGYTRSGFLVHAARVYLRGGDNHA